jgi:hypothetical protein
MDSQVKAKLWMFGDKLTDRLFSNATEFLDFTISDLYTETVAWYRNRAWNPSDETSSASIRVPISTEDLIDSSTTDSKSRSYSIWGRLKAITE